MCELLYLAHVPVHWISEAVFFHSILSWRRLEPGQSSLAVGHTFFVILNSGCAFLSRSVLLAAIVVFLLLRSLSVSPYAISLSVNNSMISAVYANPGLCLALSHLWRCIYTCYSKRNWHYPNLRGRSWMVTEASTTRKFEAPDDATEFSIRVIPFKFNGVA
jgi:hypothetical protein